MAYHLGRILEYDFGIPSFAVSLEGERAMHWIYDYDLRMPVVSLEEAECEITNNDIVIVSPAFSPLLFGWRIPGFKICYVQSFSTFSLLDRRLDHYVAVGDFVAQFLRTVYSIEARVIPPFINFDRLPSALPWSVRPRNLVLPYRKGLSDDWDLSFCRLRDIVANSAPLITLAPPIGGRLMPQRELLSQIGQARYMLTLTPQEGFGLVPLEAMAMGTVVVGYDGFGGRQYMRSGENCAVAPYAEIERVANLLIEAVRNPAQSAELMERGRETADRFTYDAFRRAWIEEFRSVLGVEAN